MDGEVEAVLIEPRALRNLVLVDEVDNFAPLTELRAADVTREGSVQLCALCGRGPRSTVRVLRHGLAVAELAVSELPGTPTAVWTVRTSAAAEYDSFIVVSFVNATLVLSIGETVEEVRAPRAARRRTRAAQSRAVRSPHRAMRSPHRARRAARGAHRRAPPASQVTDSGLLGSVATLSVQLLDGDSLCQVHAGGLRHVRAGRPISEWRAPAGKPVTRASANARQVLVALSGGELIYFELDALNNLVVHDKKELGQDASCVDLAAVPAGRQRARFAAVGTWDNYVRLIALDPDDCMQVVAMKVRAARGKAARSRGQRASVACPRARGASSLTGHVARASDGALAHLARARANARASRRCPRPSSLPLCSTRRTLASARRRSCSRSACRTAC